MKTHNWLPLFLFFALVAVGCSQNRPSPNETTKTQSPLEALYPHPKWFGKNPEHGRLYIESQESCRQCHGIDLKGGNSGTSCNQCHKDFPHSPTWKTTEHGGQFFKDRNSCKSCHGGDLQGGDTRVACSQCHTYPHTEKWGLPENHGQAFVQASADQKSAQPPTVTCSNCHSGNKGLVERHPEQVVSCLSCHRVAMPHGQNFPTADGKSIAHPKYVAANPEKIVDCISCHDNASRKSPQIGAVCSSCHTDQSPFAKRLKQVDRAFPKSQAAALPTGPAETRSFNLDYETVQREVFAPFCVKCHSAQLAKKNIKLDNYADIRAHIEAIEKSIDKEGGSMPSSEPADRKFSDWHRELITAWRKAGTPEKSTEKIQLELREPVEVAHEPEAESVVPANPVEEELYRGKYLYTASACVVCHTIDKAKPLGGGKLFDLPAGKFYAPNISPSRTHGIGNWTAEQFYRSMHLGVSPNNTYYYPIYPYQHYSKMEKRDIIAIYKYIMTLPAIDESNRQNEYRFPLSWLIFDFPQRESLRAWRATDFVSSHFTSDFRKSIGPMVYDVSQSPGWNRGAYLVEGPLHCAMCHTPRHLPTNSYRFDQWMGGTAALEPGGSNIPNITPDPETGLKNWKLEDWVKFLNTGVNPHGVRAAGEMLDFVRSSTAPLTKADKMSVAEYLMSLPPVKNPLFKKLPQEPQKH